ncbi:unnamed protein product, partial [Amoebophrya sp. A25]|eukprot:GSA25T00024632001.1
MAVAAVPNAFQVLIDEQIRDKADPVKVRAIKEVIQTQFGVLVGNISQKDLGDIELFCQLGSLHERKFGPADKIMDLVCKDAVAVVLFGGYLPPIEADEENGQPARPAGVDLGQVMAAHRVVADLLQVFAAPNLAKVSDDIKKKALEAVYSKNIQRLAGTNMIGGLNYYQ